MHDFMNIFILRCRLMFKRKSYWIIYTLVMIIVSVLIISLYQQVDRGLSIPISIVDLDQTEFSRLIIDSISENSLLNVVITDEDNGIKDVKEQKVEATIVIKDKAEEKVVNGELENLFTVYYLTGNSFIVMLTDILSGDFLDEISIITASRYYNEGYYKLVDSEFEKNIYNNVYKEGSKLDFSKKVNYYLNIELIGDSNKELSWYNQSLILEKMTVGIIYIFIGFFVLFEGLEIVRDRKSAVYKKLKILKIKPSIFKGAELLSLVLQGLLMTLPVTIISVYYGKGLAHMVLINMLYVLGISSFVYFIIHIVPKMEIYLLIGTSVILGMGIVSGSFFAIDYSNEIVQMIAKAFPNFYCISAYFDKGIIWEYSGYTGIYSLVLFSLCFGIERLTLRSKI